MRARPLPLLLALALALAACGGGSGSDTDGGRAGGPAAPGEVRIAVGEDIWPLTGAGPSSKHFAAGEVNVGIFEPLLTLGPDFTARPGLAEGWSPDGDRAWRFFLRRGVKFHDGSDFTADDVVWSWRRELLPRAVSSTLAGVTKVDDYTVEFTLTTPNRRLPEQLVHPEGPIVAEGTHSDSTPPVGTGPFRLVDYRPRQSVTVERFDGYWGEKASVDRISFRFLPDRASRLEALREGDVDLATTLPPDAVALFQTDPRYHVVRASLGATHTLGANVSGTAPFDLGTDPSVRRAVSLAIDRPAYVAGVLGGAGEPGRWMAPPLVLGPHAGLVAPPVLDGAAARKALEDGGWQRGADGAWTKGARRLSLTVIAGPALPEGALPFIRNQLVAVGIEVVAKQAQDRVTLEEFRNRGYDLDLGEPNQNDANPAFLTGNRAANLTGAAAVPPLEALASAALAAPDRGDAQRIAAQMMQGFVNDLAHVVPLAGVARAYAMRVGVDLVNPHPSTINQSWVGLRLTA